MKLKCSILVFLVFLIADNSSFAQTTIDERFVLHDSLTIDEWMNTNFEGCIKYYETEQSKRKNAKLIEDESLRHYSFRFTYKNIPLEFCRINIHKKDGFVVHVNGEMYDSINVEVNPLVSYNDALRVALNSVSESISNWNVVLSSTSNRRDFILEKDSARGELVIIPIDVRDENSKPILAYKFEISVVDPYDKFVVYICAGSGELICLLSMKRPIEGIAETRYSGTQLIETSVKSNLYCLHDSSRCDGETNIITYNLNYEESYNFSEASDFTDNDNYWSTIEYGANGDDVALDAHWAAEMTIDYFYETFGRNSLDDNNQTVKIYVHFKEDMKNAKWLDGVVLCGGGSEERGPHVALDIIAHELGHAITQYSTGLQVLEESGTIHESLSDIWAACVTNFVNPTKDVWAIGEDLFFNSAIRYMNDPNRKEGADTYKDDLYWRPYIKDDPNNDIPHHYNCGVMNYWFYLLTEGGSGINAKGNNYNVVGVGFTSSQNIVYEAVVNYFTEKTDFKKAAKATLYAALDLYGECSQEVSSVVSAWNAVGVELDYKVTANIPQSLSISEQISSTENKNYRALQGIVANSTIQSGASVVCRAGEYIYLLDGFYVKKGAYFHAYIDPCYPLYTPTYTTLDRSRSMPRTQTTSVVENMMLIEDDTYILFPNPCKDFISIDNVQDALISYKIFDIQGSLIKYGLINNVPMNIDVADLANGMYIMMFETSSHRMYKRFIKQ